MALQQVNSCCGCFNLKTGSLIFGYVAWVGTLLCLLLIIIDSYNSTIKPIADPFVQILVLALFSGLVSATMLLIGTYKRKAEYLLPFMVLNTLLVVVLMGFFLWFLLVAFYHLNRKFMSTETDVSSEVRLYLICLAVAGLLLGLSMHSLLVINSYYVILKQNSKKSRLRALVARTTGQPVNNEGSLQRGSQSLPPTYEEATSSTVYRIGMPVEPTIDPSHTSTPDICTSNSGDVCVPTSTDACASSNDVCASSSDAGV